jgi:hypothetical protein
MTRPRAPSWSVVILAALVVFRFILIAHDEIRAFPFDESAYIGQAGAWYWKNQYTDWTYSRQPGYPLFLAMGSLLGFPARLVIEALWIGAALLALRAMTVAGIRRGLQVLAFALLVFHPFPTQLFCHAYSENLYTAALLIALPALAIAITRRSRQSMFRWGLLAGAASAIAGITRQETVLVYLLISFAGAIVIKTWLLGSIPRRLAVRRLLVGCALPLSIALSAEHAVRAANYSRIGAYVTYDWSLPGFKALYRTMLSIPPESPKLRVPIPRDVREKAAAASPTYARLLDTMTSDPRCESHRRAGERTTGIPGEPGSFNLWLMRDASWILHGGFQCARDTNDFYLGIVRELREAQNHGVLPRRWAPLSFIPPQWGQLAGSIPRSLPACWRMMTRISFHRGEPFEVADVDRKRFDAVALRRHALMQPEPVFGVHMHRRKVIDRFDAIKRGLADVLPILSIVAIGLAGIGAVVSQFLRRHLPPSWFALAAMLWAAFVLRMLLVATLDATGVLASHRYMFPNAAILVPLAVLGLHAIICFARVRIEAKRAGQAVRDDPIPR